ncbi:MAG: hypothetical protein FJW37_05240 [Acidobacteria bacterium]|nr:hypothetical protein [Acidobacteriota bacterium]
MNGSLVILRAALALLAVFFAHLFGRNWVRVRRGRGSARTAATAGIRLAVMLTLVWYLSGFDAFAAVSYGLAAISGALGWWTEWRPRHEHDLTKLMFPDDPE